MFPEKVIKLARQSASHGVENHKSGEVSYVFYNEHLMNFAHLVAQLERERIATSIERLPFGDTAASFAIYVRELKDE